MDDIGQARRIQEVIAEFTSYENNKIMYKVAPVPAPNDDHYVFAISSVVDLSIGIFYNNDGDGFLLQRWAVSILALGANAKNTLLSSKNALLRNEKSSFFAEKGITWQPFFEYTVTSLDNKDGTITQAVMLESSFDVWVNISDPVVECVTQITISDGIDLDIVFNIGG